MPKDKGAAAQAEQLPGDTRGEVHLLRYWLLRAYRARQREGWEEGPTEAETFDRILDVLCNIGLDPTRLRGAADAVLAGPEWCSPSDPAGRCPLCDAQGRLDRPDLSALNATCSECGWHYTVAAPEQPPAGPSAIPASPTSTDNERDGNA